MNVDTNSMLAAVGKTLTEDAKKLYDELQPLYIRLIALQWELSLLEPGTVDYEKCLGNFQTTEVLIKQTWQIKLGDMASDLGCATVAFFLSKLP